MAHGYDLKEIYADTPRLGHSYAYRNRLDQTLRLLSEVLPPPARVLDVAAAQGNFSLALAERGYAVTWNDIRSDLVDYVRLKHETGQLSFAPGNAFELSFAEPFDAILITEIIEHVAHPDKLLEKMAELVRPGGFIVMTTPNGAYFRNRLPRFSDCADPGAFEPAQFKPDTDGHIFLLHRDEIGPMARRAGLRVDHLALFTNPLTNGHVKMGRVLKYLPGFLVALLEKWSQKLPRAFSDRVLIQIGARFQKLNPANTQSHP
jgi:2-polyprenyl-6-hydroxyphenyl methylase/3-demethylubiquinone-9 3-methyltransferase